MVKKKKNHHFPGNCQDGAVRVAARNSSSSRFPWFWCVFVTSLSDLLHIDVQLVRLVICLFLICGLIKSSFGNLFSHGAIVFTLKQLLALCITKVLPVERPEIPAEIRRRTRGCRAGAKRQEKTRHYKLCILQ